MSYTAFPDVAPALMVYLSDQGYCVTSTPPDLMDRLNSGDVIRIERVGGAHTPDKGFDEARVTVDALSLRSSDKPRAGHDRARSIEARILSLPALVTLPDVLGGGNVLLESGVTESGPVEFAWAPDSPVYAVRCIYRVTTRR